MTELTSRDAEMAVIGGLMLDPDGLHDIGDLLDEEAFSEGRHRLLYRAIRALHKDKLPVDAVTMGDWLEGHGMADLVGGAGYVIELANTTPSAANIRAYAEIVADRHLRRQLQAAGRSISEIAASGTSGKEAIGDAAKELSKIRMSQSGGLLLASQVMRETYADICERFQSKTQYSGLLTPWDDFNELTGGLQDEDLIIVAARPSMGKTAMALNIADCIASQGHAVAVFSLEMNRKQLGQRMISSHASINARGLRQPSSLVDADWPRLLHSQIAIGERKLAVDDSPNMTMDRLRASCMRMHAKHPLRLVVLDYIQLMELPQGQNKADAVGDISRGLKMLAKELGCPVVALSQLNRSLESRADKRPMMSDLRDSGAIEQDADMVVFIYRDEYYNKHTADKHVAEVIVAKQRNGETNKVRLLSELHYSRFVNIPDDYKPALPPGKSLLPAALQSDFTRDTAL